MSEEKPTTITTKETIDSVGRRLQVLTDQRDKIRIELMRRNDSVREAQAQLNAVEGSIGSLQSLMNELQLPAEVKK